MSICLHPPIANYCVCPISSPLHFIKHTTSSISARLSLYAQVLDCIRRREGIRDPWRETTHTKAYYIISRVSCQIQQAVVASLSTRRRRQTFISCLKTMNEAKSGWAARYLPHEHRHTHSCSCVSVCQQPLREICEVEIACFLDFNSRYTRI